MLYSDMYRLYRDSYNIHIIYTIYCIYLIYDIVCSLFIQTQAFTLKESKDASYELVLFNQWRSFIISFPFHGVTVQKFCISALCLQKNSVVLSHKDPETGEVELYTSIDGILQAKLKGWMIGADGRSNVFTSAHVGIFLSYTGKGCQYNRLQPSWPACVLDLSNLKVSKTLRVWIN